MNKVLRKKSGKVEKRHDVYMRNSTLLEPIGLLTGDDAPSYSHLPGGQR